MKAANKVFIDDLAIIEVVVAGDQDFDSIREIGESAGKLIERQRRAGKGVVSLVDMSQVGKRTPGVYKAGLELMKAFTFARIAIVGLNDEVKEATRLMIMASGVSKSIKIFDDTREAIDWLKSKVNTR